MCISILPEKMLDKAINKAFTKAMQKAQTPEQKQKLMNLRKEMLALDKKAKKLKLKTLIKSAPQKDIAAAEMKLKAELKKTGKIQESVLFEDGNDFNGDGVVNNADIDHITSAYNDQHASISAEIAGQNSGLTNGDVAGLNTAIADARKWAIIATIVGALLFAALVAVVVYEVKKGMDSYG